MRVLARFARGELRLGRVEAFSDGVFAIVVTLLVLELKVPPLRDAGNASELGGLLLGLSPKLVSWVISFVIVCKFWLNHHHVLGLARHADYAMVWLRSERPDGSVGPSAQPGSRRAGSRWPRP